MPSDGKIVGAFLGGLLGGPWGALVGGVVGALFDDDAQGQQPHTDHNPYQARPGHQGPKGGSSHRRSGTDGHHGPRQGVVQFVEEYDEQIRSLLALLGLRPPVTIQDIQRRYRTIAKQFHPDALISKGLDANARAEARRTFEEATRVYKALMRLLGG